jgi:hypothetical protein
LCSSRDARVATDILILVLRLEMGFSFRDCEVTWAWLVENHARIDRWNVGVIRALRRRNKRLGMESQLSKERYDYVFEAEQGQV